MKVLIAYGSKRGGTAGLAAMIGDALAIPCNRVAAGQAPSSAVSSIWCRREPRNASTAIAEFSTFSAR